MFNGSMAVLQTARAGSTPATLSKILTSRTLSTREDVWARSEARFGVFRARNLPRLFNDPDPSLPCLPRSGLITSAAIT